MPRAPRLLVEGIPVHIVQRGHSRRPVFRSDDEYRVYLHNLFKARSALSVQVLAYCLMTNHVHLILVPPAEPTAVSRLMQVIAGRQTAFFNRRYSRTGSLWEGRFKASCIETSRYLLACYRYVELNPVRAGIVGHPADYPWSSYRFHIGATSSPQLDEHVEFTMLGPTAEQRTQAYRRIVEGSDRDSHDHFIRKSSRRSQLIGSKDFSDTIAAKVSDPFLRKGV